MTAAITITQLRYLVCQCLIGESITGFYAKVLLLASCKWVWTSGVSVKLEVGGCPDTSSHWKSIPPDGSRRNSPSSGVLTSS